MLGWRAVQPLWSVPVEVDFTRPIGLYAAAAPTPEGRAGVHAIACADAPWWNLEVAAAKVYEPVLGALLADMRGQLVALCQHLGARRVLDVCCGPGGLARRMAAAGMDVCGVDLSWPMLRQAHRHCAPLSVVSPSAAPVVGPAPSVPLFVRADATSLPFASAPSAVPPTAPSFDVAVLVLALHTMPPAIGRAAVADMLRVAPYCIVADYRLAERNCDLPAVALGQAVEWLVGGEHYACYKAFMAAGGLEGFAHSQGYTPVERCRILGGAGSIIVVEQATF